MEKHGRRLFLRQLLFLGSGCVIGSKLRSSTFAIKSQSRAYPFFSSLDQVLKHDRIACIGLDFTGVHSAAHLLNGYGLVKGQDCKLLHNFQAGRWHNLRRNRESVQFFSAELNKQKPGEKLIVSIRYRSNGFNEMVDVLEKNDFQIYLFEPRSYSHALMNWVYFMKLNLFALKQDAFRPEELPVRPFMLRSMPEFRASWTGYHELKAVLSNAALVHFRESDYQNAVMKYSLQGKIWREPFLEYPEEKLIFTSPVLRKA